MSTRTRKWSPSLTSFPPRSSSRRLSISPRGTALDSPIPAEPSSSLIAYAPPKNHRNHAASMKFDDHLLFAYREFVWSWMSVDMMRARGSGGGGNGRGGGGGGGGWGDADAIYRRLMDILMMRRCVSCYLPCRQPMHIKLNKKVILKNARALVYTLDQHHRERHGVTLSETIYNNVARTTLTPVFERLLQYDTSNGKNTRVAKYILTDLVANVLPNNLPGLTEHRLFNAVQPELLKFLAKGKGDISALVSVCLSYVIDTYLAEGITMESIPCLVCKAFNRECQKVRMMHRAVL